MIKISKSNIVRSLSRTSFLVSFIFFVFFLPFVAHGATSDDLHKQINGLNANVEKKKAQVGTLQKKIDHYKGLIAEKKQKSASLEDQIHLLESRSAKLQLDIEITQDEMKSLELEIDLLAEKIKTEEAQMVKDKIFLGNLARKLYQTQFGKSDFEILLGYHSFSDFFNAMQSVIELQNGVQKTLSQVIVLRNRLKDEHQISKTKQLAVTEKKHQLGISQRELEDQRVLQEAILIETKASELEFRYQLADLKQEQNQADSEIQYLEKTLREKMNIADRLGGEDSVLSWPVSSIKGISTRFHDPDYPFRYIFEHPAIDIRCGQGTAVRAAAAGVIAKAKDAGMGYSYVMIIHNNDISTVYGHLSKIIAKEDSFIERGEIIGYSGGLPGTPGAGRLTTGPHLHFETRYKGIPTDPMRFLVSL